MKKRSQPTNDFDWTNDLSFYDSDNKQIDVSTFQAPPVLELYDEKGVLINTTTNEYPEQCISHTFIDPDATVLELGARYGSVSCIINKKLNDKTKQVSVEPDSSVWTALENNIKRNNCDITIHKGFVSKSPRELVYMGYASTAVPVASSSHLSLSVEQLQETRGVVFDTLVADCEGFLEAFFDEHPFLYDQLHAVIFEADFPNKCNYAKIRETLKGKGFREIIHGFQNVYKK